MTHIPRLNRAATQPLPSMTLAQISAPTPNWGQPPSTVTRWLVFITLVSILSTSMGRIVRRLITWHKDRRGNCSRRSGVYKRRRVPASTSHSIPSLARTAAASRQWPTYREWLTKVMWFPETQEGEEEEWVGGTVRSLTSRSPEAQHPYYSTTKHEQKL